MLAMLLIAVSAMAIPAHRGSVTVTQPDGTQLTIQLVGDEFYHFNVTDDGYTVVKNDQGVYEYAQREGQVLKASGVKAHNEGERNATEKAFLDGITKYMTDREAHATGEAQRARRDAPSTNKFNYSGFRGLIILINFTDVKFTMSDPQAFYNDMVNTVGFTGYTDDNGSWVSCTGSMRDYYRENSNGEFDPTFDVVGPIEVNYKSTDCKATSNAQTIFKAALSAANPTVNFSNYDADGDGYVDMVFFQCAGLSSSFAGNDDNLLWPHKSNIYGNVVYDGKRISLYASSTEIYGWSDTPSSLTVEGVGTMCHEFTHVMGFPDLYDTDYESSGGQSHNPAEWDIMAGGGSYNYGRTPVGYTIFERYSLGFAKPTVITEPGTYTLNSVMSNEGYILYSPVSREYWIMDNRQKTRWDYYLPGHGMVVCRVDSTNTTVWRNNTINANPDHNYYVMLRAGNTTSGSLASDPFPGTSGTIDLCSWTAPALKTWDGSAGTLGIFNISENNGVITFDVMEESSIQRAIEDFEIMPTTTDKKAQNVQGVLTTWNFNQGYVTAPGEGNCDGEHAVAMASPAAFTMAEPVYYDTYRVSFDVYNPTSVLAKYQFSYSTDGGTTWVRPKDAVGTNPVSVSGNTTTTVSIPLSLDVNTGVIYRVSQSAGSKTSPTYIDNFTIYYNGEPGSGAVKGDINGDGIVDITDVNMVINMVLGKVDKTTVADLDGSGDVDITDVNLLINIMLDK